MDKLNLPVVGPDGVSRPTRVENHLNRQMLATFSTPQGSEILRYLRSITIEAVAGPGISDAELRHREGQRFLVGIIEQRMKRATPIHDDPQA